MSTLKERRRRRFDEARQRNAKATRLSAGPLGTGGTTSIELSKLDLQPGQIVVANTPAGCTSTQAQRLMETLKSILPEGVKVVVLPDGVRLKPADKESFCRRIMEL